MQEGIYLCTSQIGFVSKLGQREAGDNDTMWLSRTKSQTHWIYDEFDMWLDNDFTFLYFYGTREDIAFIFKW